jgi:hypothetical protein
LREELATARALLADRDAESTRTAAAVKEREEQRLAEARQRWRREADEARAQAEADWKVTESARIAKAEAEWREKATKAVADLSARCERAEAALADARARPDAPAKTEDSGNQRLREDLASTRTALADRDRELAASHSNAEKALERQRQESEAAIARAKAEWKQSEVARLTAAEATWQKQSSDALAAATARFDEAERALAQMRGKSGSKRIPDDEGVVNRLRDEVASLQATLADRDRELNQSRPVRDRRETSAQPKITLRDDRNWRAEEAPPPNKLKKSAWVALDVIVVAGLAVLVVVFWPTIETFIPQSWWTSLGYPARTETVADRAPAPAQAPTPAAPPVEVLPAATVVRIANVHSDPASTATILAKVERGTQVAVIGLHGNWTRVRIAGMTKPVEGWIFNSYLVNPGADDKAAPAATAKRNTPSRNTEKASSAATSEPGTQASGDDKASPAATDERNTPSTNVDKASSAATSEPGTPASSNDKAPPTATSEPSTPINGDDKAAPATDEKKPAPGQ